MFAAAAGLAVGYAALRLLGTLNIQELPRGEEIRLDGVVVAYTVAVAAAHRVRARPDPGRQRAAGEPHRRAARGRPRAAPPVAARARCAARWSSRRSAFAFVLLIGAGLLFASFRQVLAVQPGFNPDGVLTGVGQPAARALHQRQGADRLHARGAAAAARAARRHRGRRDRHHSLRRQQQRQRDFRRGLPDEAGRVGDLAEPDRRDARAISRRCGVRLVRGRFFDDRDGRERRARPSASAASPTRARSIIVDETLAKRFWPDQDPIGRRMYKPSDVTRATSPRSPRRPCSSPWSASSPTSSCTI